MPDMTVVDELAVRLRACRPEGDEPLAQLEILGAYDDVACARLLIDLCADQIGIVDRVVFASMSVGAVVGFVLQDDRRVVAKVVRSSVPKQSIEAAHDAQRVAKSFGLAAPLPLVSPVAFANGWAAFEELLDNGDQHDVRPPNRRFMVARDLAHLARALSSLRGDTRFDRPDLAMPTSRNIAGGAGSGSRLPYPPPHSPIFDFEATSPGADWIDDAAWTALETLDGCLTDRSSLVHNDWRIENLRVNATGVSAIYDWDSLASGDEAALVGGVARAFSTHWDNGGDPMFASLDDMHAFISDYQTGRGVAFTPDEQRRCDAGLQHALAYSARCEHALGVRASWKGGYRELLRELLAAPESGRMQ
jgi:Phosphotransferase enzyme family